MIFIIIICVLIIVYLNYKLTFWKRQNLPNILSISFDKSNVLQSIHKYGKVFGTYNLFTPVLVVTKPDLINAILNDESNCFPIRKSCLKSEKLFKNSVIFCQSNDFESHRKVFEKTFSINKNLIELSKHYMKFDSEMIMMLTQITNLEPIVDINTFISMYSLKKYLSCGFGSAIDQKIQTKLNQCFQNYIQNERSKTVKNNLLEKLAISSVDRKLWSTILEIVEQIFDNRKVNDCKNSLMFMLSDADNSKVMSKKQIIENSLMSTIMGYKCSVMTISYLFYNLAINQTIQQKLIKEIDKYIEVQSNSKRSSLTEFKCSVKTARNADNTQNSDNVAKEPVVEEVNEEALEIERQEYLTAINQLEYLDACVRETLRLYPPVLQLSRTATTDKTVQNIFIPKNCRIVVPVVNVHRDPDNFLEPGKFKPDRFISNKIGAGTYLPFGDGLRNCSGIIPALLEIKLCVINVLANFRFVKSSQTKELKFSSSNELFSPLKPLEVCIKLVKRNKNVLD